MLIGLNGRLKSGKDTTYATIVEVLKDRPISVTIERVSFAAKLKAAAAASIGMDVETLEELKGREDLFFTLDVSHGRFVTDEYRFNIREYLQWFGTEGHREVFGDNFWVDQALPIDTDHSSRLIVVTDMRFPNEAQRVKDLGGLTVKVVRDTETNHAAHASEQDIDYMIDYFLDNTGTLEDLKEETLSMLSALTLAQGVKYAYSS